MNTRSKRKVDDAFHQIPNYPSELKVVSSGIKKKSKITPPQNNVTLFKNTKHDVLELLLNGNDIIQVDHNLGTKCLLPDLCIGPLENVIYKLGQNDDKKPFLQVIAKMAKLINSPTRPQFHQLLPDSDLMWDDLLSGVTHIRIETIVTTSTQGLYRLSFLKPYEYDNKMSMWPKPLNVFFLNSQKFLTQKKLSEDELTRRVVKCRQVYYHPSAVSIFDNQIITTPPICYLASLQTPDRGYNMSFTWDPSFRKICDLPLNWLAENNSKARTFITFHTYGYSGFFKPTIGEVLSQLPAYLWTDPDSKWLIRTEPISLDPKKTRLDNRLTVGITTVYPDQEVA